jgi:thiamine-monophosphate kinase
MVTGTIGDAALGLDILKEGPVAGALTNNPAAKELLVGRYRVPQPRNALAKVVREHASAAMDVSDGLAGDLTKLCAASSVSADISTELIPISVPAAGLLARNVIGLEMLISGGDDYEILCTVPEAQLAAFTQEAGRAGVVVTAIGTVNDESHVPRFLDAQGNAIALRRLSYSHF